MMLPHRRMDDPADCGRVSCMGVEALMARIDALETIVQESGRSRQSQIDDLRDWQKRQNGALENIERHLQDTSSKLSVALIGIIGALLLLAANLGLRAIGA